MTAPALAALFVIVLGAFSAEAVVGFGSTVLTVTLGAQLLPLERLLPAFVPLNLGLSLYLVARHWRSVELRMLLRQVVPFVAIGMVIGLVVFRFSQSRGGSTKLLELALAAFVIGLALLEIGRLLWGKEERPSKLTRFPAISILWLGGVVHGLFGSGGPMVVYYASREITDKGRFRATLSALWLVLNAALIVNYLSLRLLDAGSAKITFTLLPALVMALFLGERLHHRIDERMFRPLIYVLLLIAGLALGGRTLWSLAS